MTTFKELREQFQAQRQPDRPSAPRVKHQSPTPAAKTKRPHKIQINTPPQSPEEKRAAKQKRWEQWTQHTGLHEPDLAHANTLFAGFKRQDRLCLIAHILQRPPIKTTFNLTGEDIQRLNSTGYLAEGDWLPDETFQERINAMATQLGMVRKPKKVVQP